MQNNTILAVDPGFDRLGIAILTGTGSKPILLHSECIVTNPKDAHAKRLLAIGSRIDVVVKEWSVNMLAIETLFFNQNVTSAMGVAEARGVVIFQAARAGLSIFEYSPQAVKIAVTGQGKADKIQVATMVKKLISLPKRDGKMLDDELDAIALGITHLATIKAI